MTTTNGQLIIIDLTTLERLEIQFVPPTVSPSSSSTLGEVVVVGANLPSFHYVGGKRALPLRLDFHSDTDTVDDVKAKCNWLERLTQPSKQGRKNVKVIFGSLFEDEKWVVSSVNIDYSLFDMPSGFLPRQAYATIKLQQEK